MINRRASPGAYQSGSPWPHYGGLFNNNTRMSPYVGTTNPGLKWKYKTANDVEASPAIGSDGTLYFGSWDGHFYALRRWGSLHWKYSVGSDMFDSSNPAIGADGTVYTGTWGGILFAFASWGSVRWHYKGYSISDTTMGFGSSPSIGYDGTIYIGSINYYLFAIFSSGSVRWKYKTGSSVLSSPAIGNDGTLYIGSYDYSVYAIYSWGSLRWTYRTGGFVNSNPVIDSAKGIYLFSYDNFIYAFTTWGSVRWKYNIGTPGYTGGPAIGLDGVVYVGGCDSGTGICSLFALTSGGNLHWKYSTNDYLCRATPTIGSDGTIYIGTESGHLIAQAAWGSLRWSYSIGAVCESTPTIGSDGTIYVGSADYSMYAIGKVEPTIKPSMNPALKSIKSDTPTPLPSSIPLTKPPISSSVSPTLNLFASEKPTPLPSSIPLTKPPISSSASPTLNSFASEKPTPLPSSTPQVKPNFLKPTSPVDVTFSPTLIPRLFFRPSAKPNILLPTIGESTYTPTSVFRPVTITSQPGLSTSSSDPGSKLDYSSTTIGILIGSIITSVCCLCLFLLYRQVHPKKDDVDDPLRESLLKDSQNPNQSVTKLILNSDPRSSVYRSDRPTSPSMQSSRESTSSSQQSVGTPRGHKIEWEDIEVRYDAAEIGRGAFGAVYAAKWYENNNGNILAKWAAIKILHSSFESSYSGVIQRLEEEMRFIRNTEKALDSDEYTVKVYGLVRGSLSEPLANTFKAAPGTMQVGLVMRFEVGGNLANYLKRTLSLRDKIHLLTGISSALAHLHAANIIHGDVKPVNILLSDTVQPQVRLANFGVAAFRFSEDASGSDDTLTRTQIHPEIPRYSAPEMLLNCADRESNKSIARPSRKTDMYAFGVLAWEVLTQLQPFTQVDTIERLSSEAHSGIRPSLDKMPEDVTEGLLNMIEECWSAERTIRPTAAHCFSICSRIYDEMVDQTYDIFLSHTWTSKYFVDNIFTYLKKAKYRVWYDTDNLDPNVKESTISGITKSAAFLACINTEYQDNKSCVFELDEAVKAKKPIIALVLEARPMTWANPSIQSKCKLEEDIIYCDLSSISEAANWNSDGGSTPATMTILQTELAKLVKILKERGCYPTKH